MPTGAAARHPALLAGVGERQRVHVNYVVVREAAGGEPHGQFPDRFHVPNAAAHRGGMEAGLERQARDRRVGVRPVVVAVVRNREEH